VGLVLGALTGTFILTRSRDKRDPEAIERALADLDRWTPRARVDRADPRDGQRLELRGARRHSRFHLALRRCPVCHAIDHARTGRSASRFRSSFMGM